MGGSNDWMIDQSRWLTPVLRIGAGAVLVIAVLPWFKARAARRTGSAGFAARAVPSGPAFADFPHAVEVPTPAGPVCVVRASFTDIPAQNFDAMRASVGQIIEETQRSAGARVLLEIPESAPSSRRYWHGLRWFGQFLTRRGGLLVVRCPAALALSLNEHRPIFYIAVSASEPLEDALAAAATHEALQPAELDEL